MFLPIFWGWLRGYRVTTSKAARKKKITRPNSAKQPSKPEITAGKSWALSSGAAKNTSKRKRETVLEAKKSEFLGYSANNCTTLGHQSCRVQRKHFLQAALRVFWLIFVKQGCWRADSARRLLDFLAESTVLLSEAEAPVRLHVVPHFYSLPNSSVPWSRTIESVSCIQPTADLCITSPGRQIRSARQGAGNSSHFASD